MVNLIESPDRVTVSGPYAEMKDLIPKLKSRKFHYDPGTRSWWIERSSLSAAQMKNLKTLIGGGAAKQEKVLEQQKEHVELVERLFFKVLGTEFVGFKFYQTSDGIVLQGNLEEVPQALVRGANGRWSTGTIVFDKLKTDLEGFKSLLEALEKVSNRYAVRVAQIEDYLAKPKTWKAINLTMRYSKDEGLIDFTGDTLAARSLIKDKIPHASWDPGKRRWYVFRTRVTVDDLEALSQALDKKEANREEERAREEEEAKERAKAKKDEPPVQAPRRRNQRGDHCLNCGAWVPPGDGFLQQEYDTLEGDFLWKVVHSDPKFCEEVREEARIRHEKARNKQQAQKSLREYCAKPSNYVAGRHNLNGTTIMLESSGIIYGGGSWVVIEPGGDYFWYVINNGHDGDDWSNNNVSTGGAGAIGYRCKMTTEAQVLIDAAKET